MKRKASASADILESIADLAGAGAPTLDSITLASLGVFMFCDDVTTESCRDLIEFVIKANYVYPDNKPITILMNSFGGDLHAGFGAVDVMKCSRIPIQTVAIGAVCSMASLMFTAGTKGRRIMSKNSYIMTHEFSDVMHGKHHEFVAARKSQDEISERMVRHFVENTKLKRDDVKSILLDHRDHWINAKDALKYGLCDEVREPWAK